MENYQKKLDAILHSLIEKKLHTHTKTKPTLLLHACCAPCSSYVLEYLSPYFEITLYFYNPNIFPETEYARRLSELENFLAAFPVARENNISLCKTNYDKNEFDAAIDISKNPEFAIEKEKGARCEKCYRLRLENAYAYARSHNFDWFTTTLSISPFKDAQKINAIGFSLARKDGPQFLASDFKKRGGFKRSLALSDEYNLYRQEYCGCEFSMRGKK